MNRRTLFFIAVVLVVNCCCHEEFSHENVARVGIIGAGGGGSACAYWLRKLGGVQLDIEVFEKEPVAGGRVNSATISGETMELGGAVYHIANRLFADLVKEGGFEVYNPASEPSFTTNETISKDVRLGVWNGKEITFVSKSNYLLNLLLGFWRYGFGQINISQKTSKLLDDFVKVYPMMYDNSTVFHTVEELVDALQFRDLVHISMEDYFKQEQVCGWGPYCEEIVTGLTRVNYGQSMKLNALVGMIALAGSTSDIRSVRGGNYQVMEYAVRTANALLHYRSRVTKVIRDPTTKRYSIEYIDEMSDVRTVKDFDYVVIATPLDLSGIQFEGFDLPRDMNLPKYQVTHVSFVVGDADLEEYFHLPPGSDQPQGIITTESPDVEFSSLFLRSTQNAAGEKRKLYKVFSQKPLSSDQLDNLFANRTSTFQTQFHAYPVLDPIKRGSSMPKIDIFKGQIFYVNALESVFSTIETEMISGMNVAKLIINSINK